MSENETEEHKYFTIHDPDERILAQFRLQGRLTTPDLLGLRTALRDAGIDVPSNYTFRVLNDEESRVYLDDEKREQLIARGEEKRAEAKQKLAELRKRKGITK